MPSDSSEPLKPYVPGEIPELDEMNDLMKETIYGVTSERRTQISARIAKLGEQLKAKRSSVRESLTAAGVDAKIDGTNAASNFSAEPTAEVRKGLSGCLDFALPGLTTEQSLKTVCAHLFEPNLIANFITYDSALGWCDSFVSALLEDRRWDAICQYRQMKKDVLRELRSLPDRSLTHPPFSMASKDGFFASVPWELPGHEYILNGIISGDECPNVYGKLLRIAFVTGGGPGDSPDNAIRIRASTQGIRASAEHWLVRLYKPSYVTGAHINLEPDSHGRHFSQHILRSAEGHNSSMFFDITDSYAREEQDFIEFLSEYPDLALPPALLPERNKMRS